jgi:hypothetical protein
MKWDEIIMGSLAIVMGVVLLFMRPEILEFSREGGSGLRNRKVINTLAVIGIIFLLAGGAAVIALRGF